jgi:hypothetical protein
MRWEIPLLIDGKPASVLGETRWNAIAPRPDGKTSIANARP